MLRLQVEHTTIYRYRRTVELGSHRLMLRPREDHLLRTVSSALECSPRATLTWSNDVFGNSIAQATFHEAAETLSIRSLVAVEQHAVQWPVFAIATSAITYPFAYSAEERTDLGALLTPQHADPHGQLMAWAKRFVLGTSTDTLSLLKDINHGVGSIAYQPRNDERTQAPLETLSCRSGTCRDFAVLFCEAARWLGFAARTCSGYLYDPTATLNGSQGPGSTHAWAEIYLPGAGWIAFDPTNRVMGNAHLICVAVARTIEQTSPIMGGFVGEAADFLGMEVAVSVTPDVSGERFEGR